MTNVHVSTDGDLLTIRVDLPAVAQASSNQAEEWQQTAERTRTQWEQSEWYLGEAKASIVRLEEELRALREAHGQLEGSHREITARFQETERERDAAHEGTLRLTEHLEAYRATRKKRGERPKTVSGRSQWNEPSARRWRQSLPRCGSTGSGVAYYERFART